ncbi:MAG: BamA/TamA family outer membrane protein [Sandaracinaceae bacterium]|nr:BamA/TamA family outer membrane protein [Sandaracinaceae bacterium]MDW8246991.1 BamA/TamA family outer membrane protein [Sandaracinaceae bacterium]
MAKGRGDGLVISAFFGFWRKGWVNLAISVLLLVFMPIRGVAEIEESLVGLPIRSIEIDGPARGQVTPSALGLITGVSLDRERLRQWAKELLASGRWSDLQYFCEREGEGVHLRIVLVPHAVIARIEIQGSQVLRRSDVMEALDLREGGEWWPTQEEAGLQTLLRLLKRRGYPQAQVRFELRETADLNRKVLVVHIAEGVPLRIRSIVPVPLEASDSHESIASSLFGMSLEEIIGVSAGQVLDLEAIEEGIRKGERFLRERGYWSARIGEARVDWKTGLVEIAIAPGPRYRLEVEGSFPLERGEIERALESLSERLNPEALGGIEERVATLYRRYGFLSPRVEALVEMDPKASRQGDGPDPRFALLRIRIWAGPRTRVIGFSFPGATHFSSDFLVDQVRSHLEEVLPRSVPFEPVDSEVVDRLLSSRALSFRTIPEPLVAAPIQVWFEPAYLEAVEHLTELYRASGFLEAQVGPPELRELEEQMALVVIPVFEGPRTLVHDVRVVGNNVLSSFALLQAAGLRRASPFSPVEVEEGRRRILRLYRDRGHFFARVEVQTRFSIDRKRAEVIFNIEEGTPVRIGSLVVEGARSTFHDLIRQALRFRSGDLLRPEALRQSEEALLRLGVFSSVSIAPVDADLPAPIKDVRIAVIERLPQELSLAGGIGTGEGVRGSFEYTYRNLFGQAISISLRAQLAFQFWFQDEELRRDIEALRLIDRLERRITLGATMPLIPGLPGIRGGLDLVHIRDNFRDFGLDKNSIVLVLSHQTDPTLTGSLSAELEYNQVGLFRGQSLEEYLASTTDPRLQRLLRVPAGASSLASLRSVLAYDSRNNAFVPTDGFYGSAAIEWGHTLSTERPIDYSHFLKVTITANAYLSLIGRWVLALQVRLGRVFHLEPNSRVYPNRGYFLGGFDSLRGFLQDQVIPQDQVDALERARQSGMPLSAAAIVRTGEAFYLARSELRFPLIGELSGGVFVDVGNVWAFADALRLSDLLRLRVSAGVGLRFSTPVGPLAADYGFNLTRRSDQDIDEPVGSFHFSIGIF